MHANQILCPIDFSEYSEAAVGTASVLAGQDGGSVIFLHVVEPVTSFGSGHSPYAMPTFDTMEVTSQLEEFKPTLEDVACEHILVKGDPADQIVRVAEQKKVDLIVLGTHGRTGLTRMLMGSVAERVVQRAKVPVLAIKKPSDILQPAHR